MSVFLITGVAGFIGSRVADLLLQEGHFVRGLDNLNDYYDCRLKTWRLKQLAPHRNFSFELCDIEHSADLDSCIKRVGQIDAIIHLAARAGVRSSVANPRAYLSTNLAGTLNVLETCRTFSIPKLVIASSSSVYGASRDLPYREEFDNYRPLSPYASFKRAAEDLCFTYHHLHKLDISALRLFTVYGPAGRPDMAVFRFIHSVVEGAPLAIFGDGNQSRDFSFVEDIARGTILALKTTGFRVFNLGASHPVTVNDAIQMIERLSGKVAIVRHLPRDPSDVSDTWAAVTRAKNELSWFPTVSLEQGLDSALRWYIDNRAWASTLSVMSQDPGRAAATDTATSALVALSAATETRPDATVEHAPISTGH
jgi:UDP-glucuronate 4-epimerase